MAWPGPGLGLGEWPSRAIFAKCCCLATNSCSCFRKKRRVDNTLQSSLHPTPQKLVQKWSKSGPAPHTAPPRLFRAGRAAARRPGLVRGWSIFHPVPPKQTLSSTCVPLAWAMHGHPGLVRFCTKNCVFGVETSIIPGFFDFFGCLRILCAFFLILNHPDLSKTGSRSILV